MKIRIKNFSFLRNIFPLVIIIFSVRHIIASPLMLGHNWDYSFPFFTTQFQNIWKLSFYTWWPNNLGSAQILTISQLLPNFILSCMGFIFGSVLSVKILLLAVLFTATHSFNRLLNYLHGTKNLHSYISLIYGLSPFIFNEIIGGSWYMWISFAAIPIYALSLLKFSEGNKKSLIPFIFSSIFVICSVQNFVSIEVVLFLYLFIVGVLRHKLASYLKLYLISHVAIFLCNLYWIIPLISSLTTFSNQVTSTDFSGGFSSVIESKQSLLNIFNLTGYLNRNMYMPYNNHFLSTIINFAAFSFWFFIITSLVRKKDAHRSQLIIWLSVFLLSVLIVKAGNPPYANFTISFFKLFPIMNLYRSPQHLMLIPAFLTPILISYAIIGISKNRLASLFIVLLTLMWLSGWNTGDLAKKRLLIENRDHVDMYSVPNELSTTFMISESELYDHRILFLPAVSSPFHIKTQYQESAQGNLPEYMYLSNPTYNSETNIIAEQTESGICGESLNRQIIFPNYITPEYIVNRKDIAPAFTHCSGKWSFEDAQVLLEGDDRFEKIVEGDQSKTYRLKTEFLIPHIFASDDIDQHTSTSIGSINKPQENAHLERDEEPNNRTVEYKKVNSAKYIVVLHNTRSNFSLVFNETYDSLWKLHYEKSNRKGIIDTSKYKIINDNDYNQASKEEIDNYLSKNWISYLGNGSQKTISTIAWDSDIPKVINTQVYSVDFVSKIIHGTIQNNNLVASPNSFWRGSDHKLSDKNHFLSNDYFNGWTIDPVEICSNNPESCVQNVDGTYDIWMTIEFDRQRQFYNGLFLSGLGLFVSLLYSFVSISKRKNLLHRNDEKEKE